MIADENVDEPIRAFIRGQSDIEIDRYSDGGVNGELYFGKRKILKDRVALKFYFYNSKISSHSEPLLLKEISHVNILKIYDARIIDNQYAYFLTPEIIDGDLQKYINGSIISTKSTVAIVQGILNGLSVLHSEPNNFVHRDLKPNNILIDKSNLKVYIADFGSIVKIPESSNSAVASKNTFIYKPYESIIDSIYLKQSDIYQVGIILFQLLKGYFPMATADWLSEKQRKKLSKISGSFEQWQYVEEIINQKIVRGKLLDYDTLPNYIDKSFKRILSKATHLDYKQRFQSCAEFLKALFDYSKTAIDWKFQDDIYYATDSDSKEYKIYKEKAVFVLEEKIKAGVWRKNNKHDGTLDNIFRLIRKEE